MQRIAEGEGSGNGELRGRQQAPAVAPRSTTVTGAVVCPPLHSPQEEGPPEITLNMYGGVGLCRTSGGQCDIIVSNRPPRD